MTDTNRSFCDTYMIEVAAITCLLNVHDMEVLARHLHRVRSSRGRLFIIGLGGSAANASHAANDFRKLCAIETYCLTDNVSEFTAHANDSGWDTAFVEMLKTSNASFKDALLVLSVGGGVGNVSAPIIKAVEYSKQFDICVLGIVGRDGGVTKQNATACVVIPTHEQTRITPHTEAFQSVVLHCLVSHPSLQIGKTKW